MSRVVTTKIDIMELSCRLSLLMVVGLLFAPTSAQTIGGFAPVGSGSGFELSPLPASSQSQTATTSSLDTLLMPFSSESAVVSSRLLQPTRVEPSSSLSDGVLSTTTLLTSSLSAVVASGLPPGTSISPTPVATIVPTAAPGLSPSPAPVIIGFDHAHYSVSEDVGSVPVCITVSGPPGVSVSVTVTAEDGTAQAGQDYTFPMALRLPSLSSLTCIQDVGILDDGDVEDSETFTLSLSSSNNNIVYSNRNATVTIVDNDAQPPQLRITSNIGGVVVAGDSYSIRCEVTFNGNLILPIQIRWLDPSGNRIVNSTNITILGTTIPVRNGAIQDLNFTAIRTSQAGRYRCEADVYTTRNGNITLAGQFSLNVKLPTPLILLTTSAGDDLIIAGTTLNLSCVAIVNTAAVDTPISAMVSWQPSSVYEDDLIRVLPTTAVTSAMYRTRLIFDPILPVFSNNYTCLASFWPTNTNTTPFVVGGDVLSRTIEISVDLPQFNITISPSAVTIPNAAPYNMYNITCNATSPNVWITWYDSSTGAMFFNNASISITTEPLAESQGFTSTLSVTETRSGVFLPRCEVRVFSDLTTGFSQPVAVTVTGPSPPSGLAENVTIVGVSYELAIIQWVVQYIAYTPETYRIQYRKEGEEEVIQTSIPIMGSTNFSAVNEQFTLALDGLDANATYYATVVSSNTIGTDRTVEVMFQTLATDIYNISVDPSTIEVPLGARLSFVLSFSTPPIRPEYMFYPLYHTPLQQATFIEIRNGVELSYNRASPSLTGTYVACRSESLILDGPTPVSSLPAQCGRKISLNVTIPALNISTNLLVHQYNGPFLLMGESLPQVSCIPSDLRAPVRWTTRMGMVPADYQITFSPRGFSHIATFARVYNPTPPNRTETLFCDLVNVDQPDQPVSPQNVTVRFIQTPVALLNDDRELVSNAVINTYRMYLPTNQSTLNLRCIGTNGNGRLQWFTREVEALPRMITSTNAPAIEGLNVTFLDQMQRDTNLVYRPVNVQSIGYYICSSGESGYTVEVYTTLIDPLWELLVPTASAIEFPIGAVVTITARYADSSSGYINSGRGFSYMLLFLPCIETMPDEMLASGISSPYSNQFTYSFRAGVGGSGLYQLNATHLMTGRVFSNGSDIVITVPHLVEFDRTVYVQRDRNVTLRCIPNDTLAPVLWRIQTFEVDLEREPRIYILSPPGLNHTATFNATAVALMYSRSLNVVHRVSLQCGFINGDNTGTPYNRQLTDLYIQPERLRMQYTDQTELNIFNNTVINTFPRASPPPSKREISRIFSVDCFGAQGDHNPFWSTNNPLLDDENGIVGYESIVLSNYSARVELQAVTPGFNGTFSCVSNRSGLFSHFFLTTENPYVRRVSLPVVTVLEGDPVRLEFVVAVNSNGNTWIREVESFTFTSTQQQRRRADFEVYSSTFPQNYALDIASVSRSDEGVYTASVQDLSCEDESELNCIVETNITLNVIKFCPREVSGGILWLRTVQGTPAMAPCRNGGDRFRRGPIVTRSCLDNGEWAEADFSSCTLDVSDGGFLLLWFVIETDEISDTQRTNLEANMRQLLNMYGVQYTRVTLQSVYITSVAVTFEITLPTDTSAQNVEPLRAFGDFFTNDFQSLGVFVVQNGSRGTLQVIPTDSCPCVRESSSSIELCAGAAVSPCDCNGGTGCECQDPFVGDGVRCTLDSDGDGYPDQPLQSSSCSVSEGEELPRYCQQDVCVSVNNPNQMSMSCVPNITTTVPTFNGCPYGPDSRWNITWANTPRNTVDTQRCPGGVDTRGNATRFCMGDGNWAEPNVLECESLEFRQIRLEAAGIFSGNRSITQVLAQSAAITNQIVIATNATVVSLLPSDLNTTNSVLSNVISALEDGLSSGVTAPDEQVVDVLNNILEENNLNGWMDLQEASPGSQLLLDNAERYGLFLASSLNDSNQTQVLSRGNIVISARQFDATNMDMSSVESEVFPTEEELVNYTSQLNAAQIIIPAQVLLEALASEGSVPIAHILFQNLEDFLPSSVEGLNNSRGASAVVSSQIGHRQTALLVSSNTLEQNPVSLMFNFTSVDEALGYRCAYWNFSEPVGNGSWESEGTTIVSNMTDGNTTSVQCLSTHLTSFAVLIDVGGGLQNISPQERLALQIVSYIGCGISVVCLIIAIVFFLLQGKKLFTAVHLFVHLNLSISLLLGYLIFMIGIETARSSTGGCAFVAALLQYLFLAAFCWMMCEGIMLYLMLVVVFSTLSKKWWFFLLLGWATPIPIVVISVASRYQDYGILDEQGNLSLCWLSVEEGTIFAFVVPVLVIILINVVFLCLALRSLWRSKKGQTKVKKMDKDEKIQELAKTTFRATVILLPLLGLTWVFGIPTVIVAANPNATVFAWLFTIFNSLQGVGILFFHVIRSEKVWSKIGPRLTILRERTLRTTLRSRKYEVSSSAATASTLLKGGTYKAKKEEKEYEMSTHSKHTTSTDGTEFTSLVTSEIESETTSSAVPAKQQTCFVNPLVEKVPLSVANDEVVDNPSADQRPEQVAQTEVTIEKMAPENVECSSAMDKEFDP